MKSTDAQSGLTWDRLCELLEAYPENGHFVWKVWRGGSASAGALAGTTGSAGYPMIKVDGRFYLSHRLMWFFVHKGWPADQLDHINLDKEDFRIANLREATTSQNVANGLVRRDSQSGVRGVRQVGNRWMANATKDGVKEYLGLHETPEAAAAVYSRAASRLHGEFARS